MKCYKSQAHETLISTSFQSTGSGIDWRKPMLITDEKGTLQAYVAQSEPFIVIESEPSIEIGQL